MELVFQHRTLRHVHGRPWCGPAVRRLVCGGRDADARGIGFDEGPKPSNWIAALETRGIARTPGRRPKGCGGSAQTLCGSWRMGIQRPSIYPCQRWSTGFLTPEKRMGLMEKIRTLLARFVGFFTTTIWHARRGEQSAIQWLLIRLVRTAILSNPGLCPASWAPCGRRH